MQGSTVFKRLTIHNFSQKASSPVEISVCNFPWL